MVIAIGGAPGVGKTTLLRQFIQARMQPEMELKKDGLCFYHEHDGIMLLGDYVREGTDFHGTDRLSMACHSDVRDFIKKHHATNLIVFEGDRLFSENFISWLTGSGVHVETMVLTAEKSVIDGRLERRGSEQNPTWYAGRLSKVNAVANSMFITKMIIDVSEGVGPALAALLKIADSRDAAKG